MPEYPKHFERRRNLSLDLQGSSLGSVYEKKEKEKDLCGILSILSFSSLKVDSCSDSSSSSSGSEMGYNPISSANENFINS
jgi:hypothetical protein